MDDLCRFFGVPFSSYEFTNRRKESTGLDVPSSWHDIQSFSCAEEARKINEGVLRQLNTID